MNVRTDSNQADAGQGITPQELLDRVNESLLLSADDYDRAVRALANSAGDTDALARALIDLGIVTAFQMEAVRGGTHAELRIGNYIMLDRLGTGGMGTVYKARHRRMNRIVALKVLSRSLGQDETFVQRF
jgi:serine/threonine protein kinase